MYACFNVFNGHHGNRIVHMWYSPILVDDVSSVIHIDA